MRPGTHRITHLGLAASLALAALLVSAGPQPARAQVVTPPSLQGEHFSAFETQFSTYGSVEMSSSECIPATGETFTLTYEAAGVALGPYPGTLPKPARSP